MTTAPERDVPVFKLSLDTLITAVAGEAGVLKFWIRNLSGQLLTRYRIRLQGGPWTQVPESQVSDPRGLQPQQDACCDVPIKTDMAGTHAFRVAVEAFVGPEKVAAEVVEPFTITIAPRGDQGKPCVTIPPGSYVNKFSSDAPVLLYVDGAGFGSIEGPVEVRPTGDQRETYVKDYTYRAPDAPKAQVKLAGGSDRIELLLRDVPPEWANTHYPDFALFAQAWQAEGLPHPVEFTFIDLAGRPWQRSREGDIYCLRLRSYRGGCITLLTRGSSASYFQLVPHLHYGAQTAPANTEVFFPRRPPGGSPHAPKPDPRVEMLINVGLKDEEQGRPDPDNSLACLLPTSGHGQEVALVIVSRSPLVDPVALFKGDEERPRTRTAEEVRAVLHRVWRARHSQEIEVSCARMLVDKA